MTDTKPRDLIKLLIDALKEECNWIDNPKHDELIAKATAYLTQCAKADRAWWNLAHRPWLCPQCEPETATDEELNSKSSPNNLQIRSFDIVPPPDLIRQWMEKTEYDEDTWFYESYIAEQAAQWGADQELEACCEWVKSKQTYWAHDELRADRRPKPPSLKEEAQAELKRLIALIPTEGAIVMAEPIRRALEQLPDHE